MTTYYRVDMLVHEVHFVNYFNDSPDKLTLKEPIRLEFIVDDQKYQLIDFYQNSPYVVLTRTQEWIDQENKFYYRRYYASLHGKTFSKTKVKMQYSVEHKQPGRKATVFVKTENLHKDARWRFDVDQRVCQGYEYWWREYQKVELNEPPAFFKGDMIMIKHDGKIYDKFEFKVQPHWWYYKYKYYELPPPKFHFDKLLDHNRLLELNLIFSATKLPPYVWLEIALYLPFLRNTPKDKVLQMAIYFQTFLRKQRGDADDFKIVRKQPVQKVFVLSSFVHTRFNSTDVLVCVSEGKYKNLRDDSTIEQSRLSFNEKIIELPLLPPCMPGDTLYRTLNGNPDPQVVPALNWNTDHFTFGLSPARTRQFAKLLQE